MKRNKERVLALADLIETLHNVEIEFDGERVDNGFDMRYLKFDCNTPSCIAGWSAWEAQGRPDQLQFPLSQLRDAYYLEKIAAEWLGLEVKREHQFSISQGEPTINPKSFPLFYPEDPDAYNATPQQAAAMLRHFAETGEIIWKGPDDDTA